MSVKSDKWIIKMAKEHKMLEPFEKAQVRKNVISFGVSAYGYDMRVDNEFKIYTGDGKTVIDPKSFNEKLFKTIKNDHCLIPPHSFILAKSVEYFRIPRKVITICFGKSTFARCGVIVNVTPFEPEWEGYVTMAISNTSPSPVKIYANEGIAVIAININKEHGNVAIILPGEQSPSGSWGGLNCPLRFGARFRSPSGRPARRSLAIPWGRP